MSICDSHPFVPSLFVQALALYDRFGRVMFGNEDLERDCLEYIVFENHLSDTNGRWRIHDKVIPEWGTQAPPVVRTMRQPNVVEEKNEKVQETERSEGDKAHTASA